MMVHNKQTLHKTHRERGRHITLASTTFSERVGYRHLTSEQAKDEGIENTATSSSVQPF